MDRLSLPLLLLLSLVSGAHLQNHESTPPDLQALLRDLHTKVDALQKDNSEMKSRLEKSEYEVEILRKDREDGRVVFSAALYAPYDSGLVRHLDEETTVIFKHVFTNIGDAYNNQTGIFTAPHRGVYSFEFYILVGFTVGGAVRLYKNTERVVAAFEHQKEEWGSAGNKVILQLEPGDQVHLKLVAGRAIYDDQGHQCTFSGRLLFLV